MDDENCKPNIESPPEAVAEIVPPTRIGGVISLVVGCCPLCGKQHAHGGGTDLARVDEFFGGRAAHCASPASGSYVLVRART